MRNWELWRNDASLMKIMQSRRERLLADTIFPLRICARAQHVWVENETRKPLFFLSINRRPFSFRMYFVRVYFPCLSFKSRTYMNEKHFLIFFLDWMDEITFVKYNEYLLIYIHNCVIIPIQFSIHAYNFLLTASPVSTTCYVIV